MNGNRNIREGINLDITRNQNIIISDCLEYREIRILTACRDLAMAGQEDQENGDGEIKISDAYRADVLYTAMFA